MSGPAARTRRAARWLAVACACLLALAPAVWAKGSDSVPSDLGIDEYVESLPSSSGPRAPGITRPSGADIPLTPQASRSLAKAGRSGRQLRRIATSRHLGAPSRRLRVPQASDVGPGGAVVGAAADGLGDVGGTMLLVLLAITGLLVAARWARRPGSKDDRAP